MDKHHMIRLARSGDRGALSHLCEHYHPLLYRFFVRMGASSADADDFSQDTLLKMMENLHTFHFLPGHSFSGWLFRIAYNLFIDSTRRKKPLPLIDDFPVPDAAPTPEQSALRNESIRELKEALCLLDDESQALLAMRYELDMNYAQISQAMNISLTRVKWRLNEAKVKLRSLLSEEPSEAKGADQRRRL